MVDRAQLSNSTISTAPSPLTTTGEPHQDPPWALVGGGGGGGGGGAGGGGGGSGGGGGLGSLFDGGAFSKLAVGLLLMMGLVQLLVLFEGEDDSVPRRLMEAVMVLPGETIDELDDAFMDASFATPEDRRAVIEQLLTIVKPGTIESGFIRVLDRSEAAGPMLVGAKRHYEDRLQRLGLEKHGDTDLPTARVGDSSSEMALLGLIVTRPQASGSPPIHSGTRELRLFLRRLQYRTIDEGPLTLYLYYAPDPGNTLDAEAANAMLDQLDEIRL